MKPCGNCGNDLESKGRCCRKEISNLRSRQNHLEGIITKLQDERDRAERRESKAIEKLESTTHQLEVMQVEAGLS